MTPEKLIEHVEFFGSAKASYAVAHAANDPEAAANFCTEALNSLANVKAEIDRLAAELAAMEQDRDRLRGELTVVRRERAWLLSNLDDAEREEFRLLAQTAERARQDAAEPERTCKRCGGPNVRAWCAPSPLWNEVMRGGDINGTDRFDGIVCPVCFAALAEDAGIARMWRFYAEKVLVQLATVTPSGRVWNEQTWLWDERPVESQPCPDHGKAVSDEDALDPAAPPIGAVLHALGDIILDPGEYRSSTCPYCFDPASTPEHRERCQP